MPWVPPVFIPGIVWQDRPSTGTPLDAINLNLEENAEAIYAATVGTSLVTYFEGGFSPSVPTGQVITAGNLGSVYTIDLASTPNKLVTFTGTLTVNCTITIANRAAGCQVYLLITQDGTGGRTLSISDGSASSSLVIASTANALSTLLVTSPDSANIDVSALGASGFPASMAFASPIGRGEVFVDVDAGSDTNSGRSIGQAFRTVAAALTAMPNGGRIALLASANNYSITSALNLSGHTLEGIARSPGGTQALVVLEHNFNGNMIVCGANGATLRNLLLYQDSVVTSRTGAALVATSSASNGGEIIGENLVFSGGDGWERDLILDGSAWATFGIRKCVFINCQFFGARTASETIKVTRGVHCKFIGGFIDPAPTVVNQGIKILDIGTTDVQFVGFRTSGDFLSEAAGGLIYEGIITGTVTCASSSAGNRFIGQMGAFANSGSGLTNIVDGFLTWNIIPYNTGWTTGSDAAAWAIDPQGKVNLRGRITTAGTAVQINLGDTLPHPLTAQYMVAEGNLAFAVVTMSSVGALSLATPAGALSNLSLNGLSYPTN